MENDNLPKVKKSLYSRFVKRLLDVILSFTAIVLLLPLLILICILSVIFQGFPIFFFQDRVGKNGKIFKLCKFRSMRKDKKTGNGGMIITKYGHFLRRFSLDELPELFCILFGKMSIIGPRPLLPSSLNCFTKRHFSRHFVKPGLALVSLKPLKTWTWNDQFENDIWYIENLSFIIDLKMVFAVAKEAIKGSEYRVNDTREEFNGDNLFD